MGTEMTLVDSGALSATTSTEIDIQINTARRFPRAVTGFRDEVRQLATLNEGVAGECSYALPRDGKTIEGPSARFAEILASAWGNCRFGARITGDDGRFITAQGYFHDLQKNTAVQFEVRRPITTRKGFRYSDDMVATTGNAAASIALRNAVLKGVPKALWSDLWEESRKCATGDSRTLSGRRIEALKLFAGYGVQEAQVFGLLGVQGIEDVDMNHLMTLRGLVTAFKEGDTTPEEVFRPKTQVAYIAPIKDAENISSILDDFSKREQEKAFASVPTDASPGHSHDTRTFEDVIAAPLTLNDGAAPPSSGSPEVSDTVGRAFQMGREAALNDLPRAYPKGSNFHYRDRANEGAAFMRGYDEIAATQGKMVGP